MGEAQPTHPGIARELALLLVLAALWGVSYTFLKVAVATIPPITLIAGRTLIAGLLLVVIMVREYEYQVRTSNGSVLWLSDSASAVHNEAGVIIRYEGTVRDITDQKRAEDAIAEGRRLLQMVIDTVPAVINVKDKELRYILMNR